MTIPLTTNTANAVSEDIRIAVKPNILVVDDRPDGLLALEAVLTCDDYTLVKAASGQEALQQALAEDFAVILLDVQMPELDGFQTACRLRENPRARQTPIIFVTAINKEARHINQGYEHGAVDYIFKPLDPFVLKSKVGVFVDLFNKNLQIKRQAQMLHQIDMQKKERQMLEMQQESVTRYVSLADAVPHIIVKIHPKGTIDYFNQRWTEYTGLRLQSDWLSAVHPGDRRKVLSLWRSMSRGDMQSLQMELRIRGADHTYRWHLVKMVPESRGGRLLGWIATCTDIDNIKKTEERFRMMSLELNRSNKELEEFGYVVSHDLREPLHVISSFICLLERRLESKLGHDEHDYLKFIKQAVGQAQMFIKELLEYSRIGKEKRTADMDLSVILAEVMANLQTAIDESGAVITYDPLPRLKANRLEMFQLFQNLIQNAVKYRNGKELDVHISAKLRDNDTWLFSVKDNGIGIDPRFKERIFEMFQKLHPKSQYTGVGIGLAVCKKIVENHGGKIWVESELGHGATFHFTIRQQGECINC